MRARQSVGTGTTRPFYVNNHNAEADALYICKVYAHINTNIHSYRRKGANRLVEENKTNKTKCVSSREIEFFF